MIDQSNPNLIFKVLWGENAPGLFTSLGKGVIEKLRKIGEHFGYSFSVMKTSTGSQSEYTIQQSEQFL